MLIGSYSTTVTLNSFLFESKTVSPTVVTAVTVLLPQVTVEEGFPTPRSIKGLPPHSCAKQLADEYGLRHSDDPRCVDGLKD